MKGIVDAHVQQTGSRLESNASLAGPPPERDQRSGEAALDRGRSPAAAANRNRPLRVVFFNRSYYPDFGATGQLLTELCEDLVARFGYDVTVVAGMPTSAETAIAPVRWYAPVRREERNGVKILRAWSTSRSTRRFSGRISNYLSYFSAATLASFRLGRPDVIVSLTDPPIVSLTAIAAAKATGAKFVFLCQDIFPEVARLLEDFQNDRVEALLTKIGRFTVKHADRIIALGDTMTRRLVETKQADPLKIRVIHNWSDAAAIQPGPKDNPFAREQGLVDKFVVMHSGNVGMSQNVDALLDVAAQLTDLPDVVIAIVGEGARKMFLQREVERRRLTNVRFFPYQPKARLTDSFATADVFVVSLKSGLAGFIVPSKVYGVLVAGRPYIAAIEADSEAAQIAREYECGVVVDPGNREQIATAIRTLHDDRAYRARLGANARKAALRYDRPRAVEQYRDVLVDVVQG